VLPAKKWAKTLRSNAYRLLRFSLGLAVGLCCCAGARSDDDEPKAVQQKAPEKRPASQAQKVKKPAPRPLLTFSEILKANFAKWDADGDGQLTRKEINALVISPAMRGRTAAAVATLHLYMREHPKQEAIPRSDVVPSEAGPARLSLDDVFDALYRRISRTSREVFADNCVPSIESVSEGAIGDCFFLAALGSAVRQNPKAVQGMFKLMPNGGAWVDFPGGPRIMVHRLTDSEIALTSTAENQGVWLKLLEKGYGEACLRHWTRGPTKQPDDLGIDVIARGGDARQTITLLTGHIGTLIKFRHDNEEKLPPTGDDFNELREKIHDLMQSRVEHHSLMVAGTTAGHLLPGLTAHHDYAVVGYDVDKRVVHLWNPQGEPGGDKSTKCGSFDLSLDDFLKSFGALLYETDHADLVPRVGKPRPRSKVPIPSENSSHE
jgi:hypothetical protein